MKYLKVLVLLTPIIILVIIQACKNNNVVQPPNVNNQTENSPVLLNPPNNLTTQELQPLLDWQDYNSATSYRVQISLDANFAGTMLVDTSGIIASQFAFQNPNITTGIYYYWRVIAAVPSGSSAWSSSWRFRIILVPPPPPNLLLPPDASVNQPPLPLFDWGDSPTAQYYRLQVSSSSNFQPLLLDTTSIQASQLQCPLFVLNTNSQYYWRVNASNSNGISTSDWSSVFSFTTISGPEPSSISGTITFVDSNFTQPSQDKYFVGAYTQWPPTLYPPVASALLQPHFNGNNYTADYTLHHLPDGPYIITVYYLSSPNFTFNPILGIYGCDTVHLDYSNCPNNPAQVQIINAGGEENKNILSWANTAKRIF
jgi:hypothetical protein